MAGPAGSDAFADAPEIAVGDESALTDLASYSTETAEPPDATALRLGGAAGGGDNFIASAWWKFIPDETQTIRLDLLGDFNTEIQAPFLNVYTGGGIGIPESDELLRCSYINSALGGESGVNLDGTITDIFLATEGVTYWVQAAINDPTSILGSGVTLKVSAPTNYVWLLPNELVDPSAYPHDQELPFDFVGGSTFGECLRSNDGKHSYIEMQLNEGNPSFGTFWTPTFLGSLPLNNNRILSITTVSSFKSGPDSDGLYGGGTGALGLVGACLTADPADWPAIGEADPQYRGGISRAFMNLDTFTDGDVAPGIKDAVCDLARGGWFWFISHGESAGLGLAQMGFHGIRFELGPPLGPTIQPPLRRYPRHDGLASSSAARKYPPAPSVQASNRRAGGYL